MREAQLAKVNPAKKNITPTVMRIMFLEVFVVSGEIATLSKGISNFWWIKTVLVERNATQFIYLKFIPIKEALDFG